MTEFIEVGDDALVRAVNGAADPDKIQTVPCWGHCLFPSHCFCNGTTSTRAQAPCWLPGCASNTSVHHRTRSAIPRWRSPGD